MAKRTPALEMPDGRTVTVARAHGARYSDEHITLITTLLERELPSVLPERLRVLDPMAGVGGIHALDGRFETVGTEIEQPYVDIARRLFPHRTTMQGDAGALDIPDGTFDAVVVSPDYGNRLADHHAANERCSACKGTGVAPPPGPSTDGTVWVGGPCEPCNGKGTRGWTRRAYLHDLRHLTGDDDYQLAEHSSCRFYAWQPDYWRHQVRYWMEAHRVLRPDGLFLLDVKDFVRHGLVVTVVDGHRWIVEGLGFDIEAVMPVSAPGNRFGSNGELRVSGHRVIVARKPEVPS